MSIVGVVGCLAALAVRRDHEVDAARARDVVVPAPRARANATEERRRVCDALERAGPLGLRLSFFLLRDPEARVRAGTASYLGLRGSRLAVPHLVRLLHDPEPLVRGAAAASLGAIGDPQALPFLERALADDDLEVVDAALDATRRIREAQEAPRESRIPAGLANSR
jgi:HEAT repeat protein